MGLGDGEVLMLGKVQCRRVAFTRRISSGTARVSSVFLLGIALIGCRHAPREPVTLRYSYSWNEDRPQTRALLQQFTQETGIRVKNIPVPEMTREYVELARKLLGDSSGADVLNIDLIWSPLLQADLLDLRPYLAPEISQLEPQLLPSYTVNGKLVAVPFNVPLGSLEYRTDLLRKYGYDHPPQTWDELENMGARIQGGERAKGKKDFWGYVWQGAAAEALTCNALEWQVGEGGGRIIEADGTISVNNPSAIRSWQRAAHWVGWISPPSVLTYRELDSIDTFDAGNAAFNRVWGGTSITPRGLARQPRWRSVLPPTKTGYTNIPSGSQGWAATLGGSGLAVSRRSIHPQEAIELVRFLLRAQIQSSEKEEIAGASQPEVYNRPSFLDPLQHSKQSNRREGGVVTRPSSVTGGTYERVTRAYIDAVHSVLTAQRDAPEAAAELEKQLTIITGFRTGGPKLAH